MYSKLKKNHLLYEISESKLYNIKIKLGFFFKSQKGGTFTEVKEFSFETFAMKSEFIFSGEIIRLKMEKFR